jgi:hypothetical protein
MRASLKQSPGLASILFHMFEASSYLELRSAVQLDVGAPRIIIRAFSGALLKVYRANEETTDVKINGRSTSHDVMEAIILKIALLLLGFRMQLEYILSYPFHSIVQ